MGAWFMGSGSAVHRDGFLGVQCSATKAKADLKVPYFDYRINSFRVWGLRYIELGLQGLTVAPPKPRPTSRCRLLIIM